MKSLGADAACTAANATKFKGVFNVVLGGVTATASYIFGSDWGRSNWAIGVDTDTKIMNAWLKTLAVYSNFTAATAQAYMAGFGCSPFVTADQTS